MSQLEILRAVAGVVGPLLVLSGLSLSVIAIRTRRATSATGNRPPSHVSARGTVVRWHHSRRRRASTARASTSLPVVRFRTFDGREIEARARAAIQVGAYRTGHEIDIWYRADDPTNVTAMRPGAFAAIIGVFLVVFGAVVTAIAAVSWAAAP